MWKPILSAIAIGAIGSLTAMADTELTRGIGIYPGRASEDAAPRMVPDSRHRNVALHRAVTHSSTIDVNLTGQLVTDGIVSTSEPPRLTVTTNDGPVARKLKEKTLDGNIHTMLTPLGEDAYIEFHWEGMTVPADSLFLRAECVYNPETAKGGYSIQVLGSRDGQKWTVLGEQRGRGLPGEAAEQQASSDPNKWEDRIMLPMRRISTGIQLKDKKEYPYIRIALKMKGAAYWRVYNTELFLGGKPQDALPSSHFASTWMSNGGGEQWLVVDFGAPVDADEIRLYWIYPAAKGCILSSADGETWTPVAEWNGLPSNQTQDIPVKFIGRYLKLLLSEPGAAGAYALSELEVMGQGGLTATVPPRHGMKDNKYYLNGGDWKLWRKGDTHPVQATVPGTALTSYLNIGAIPDTNVGDNMRQVSESYFNSDWIYRTEFDVPAGYEGQKVYINFDGINWKANVKVNGGKAGRIEGAFKRGVFDVTDLLKPTGNVLEVEIEKNAHPGAVKLKDETTTDVNGGILGADNPTFHASIGWDWITSTPGREAGIWNDVYLTSSRGVRVSDPLLRTQLSGKDTLATMTPSVILTNDLGHSVDVTVKGNIGDISFNKKVTLAPGANEVTFTPQEFPQLRERKMRLWWPVGYGEPYLYDASFAVEMDGKVSDALDYKAGVREVTYSDLDTQTRIYVNGRRVTPLGGNWGFSENHLRYRDREYDTAVALHKDQNFNMIRNWVGQIGDREFYEACDRHGVMIWQDFWLANPWDGPDPYEEGMFMANARDYVSRIRRHPSIVLYVGRNEGVPPESLDTALRTLVHTAHPGLDYIPDSADRGVSGHGPYQYTDECKLFEWQSQKLHSERGMPAVPNIESLERMLHPEDMWPIGTAWGQHDFTRKGAQGGETFIQMVEDRFGECKDAEEFARRAQWVNYDGYRAMYESSQQYRMGLLIWMSHPAWPSMVWQTYDYYFESTAAYFGAKKACEPLHIMYNPLKKSIQIVDIAGRESKQYKAKVRILDYKGRELSDYEQEAIVNPDTTVDVMAIEDPKNVKVWYLDLALLEGDKVVSRNFYVRSREPRDMRVLTELPEAEVEVSQNFELHGDTWYGTVTLTNRSDEPALMTRLNLVGSDGQQILPVFYSDNYLPLMPEETRTVTVTCRTEDARGLKPHIEISTKL